MAERAAESSSRTISDEVGREVVSDEEENLELALGYYRWDPLLAERLVLRWDNHEGDAEVERDLPRKRDIERGEKEVSEAMEEDMVEDTENAAAEEEEEEEEVDYSFTVYEIDLDYEFDAARFFDFSRDESPLEARQAELWFESAGSYPPSSLMEMLVPREDLFMEAMNLSKSDTDVETDHEISATELNCRGERQDKGTSTSHIHSQQKFQNQSQKLRSGLAFYNSTVKTENPESQTKISKKHAFPKSSTLMKPTASQLAKQNRPFQAINSRSRVAVLDRTSKNGANTCVVENQAAKRQKLEGGLLRKVMGTAQLQQTNFVHKASKRDELLHGNITHTKPRITIPRDPDLETTHRAQRTREKSNIDENLTTTFRRFKALPLNRKILEAPSLLPKRRTPRLPDFQEFHLKTSERALQHSSGILKSTAPLHDSNKDLNKFTTNLTTDYGSRDPGRPSMICSNASNPDGCQSSRSFKALPLNKKILSSKGDIGIFRNWKKESTVPMEFNFQTDKRFHNNPPIELFNKLSLACESQPEPKAPWSMSTPAKGPKENSWGSFQQGYQIKNPAKPKLPLFGATQKLNTIEEKIEVSFVNWSKPIR
ncbi:Cell cycle regulated microtubule associated protein [Striga hermonthica]|uniref:Cell cycle regulated microtubule associated protein n=1 Tax=Striga hermonthica TaxID=68872 RepID=A0A9N7NSZ2_STRHE|nr:Cell cycle regulated microtubule associated protein [Striga hermonthica]